ncbi:hypothetical protein D3C85_1566730 [compost metagenome]
MICCNGQVYEFIRIDYHAHIQISPVHGILENIVIRIQEEIVDQTCFFEAGKGVFVTFLLDLKGVVHSNGNSSGRFR